MERGAGMAVGEASQVGLGSEGSPPAKATQEAICLPLTKIKIKPVQIHSFTT
jgi:hypothetical protein